MWVLLIFNNIFTENMLGMWEKRRGFIPHGPAPQYICTNLPKTDDTDRSHKNDVNTLS